MRAVLILMVVLAVLELALTLMLDVGSAFSLASHLGELVDQQRRPADPRPLRPFVHGLDRPHRPAHGVPAAQEEGPGDRDHLPAGPGTASVRAHSDARFAAGFRVTAVGGVEETKLWFRAARRSHCRLPCLTLPEGTKPAPVQRRRRAVPGATSPDDSSNAPSCLLRSYHSIMSVSPCSKVIV
jgi:hypothetical protein